MNINRALEHFKWKFENKWKPTEKDIEAYNSILKYKEHNESYNLCQNELLAKLWIHQLILLSNTQMYDGEQCIRTIDEILEKSVYHWCLELKDKLPIMRFNAISKTGTDEELIKVLQFTISEEDTIKFVEKHITRIINKYEK